MTRRSDSMANDSEKIEQLDVIELMQRRLRRRTVLGGAAGAAAGVLGAGLLRGDASAAGGARSGALAAAHQELPADAAPPEKQIYVAPDNVTTAKVLDFYEKVYERPTAA